jgi:hypothetical protein
MVPLPEVHTLRSSQIVHCLIGLCFQRPDFVTGLERRIGSALDYFQLGVRIRWRAM